MGELELTDKQKRFCEEYMLDFNGTQAAIRSGYSENTAQEIASQNLSKLIIQAYLSELKTQAANEYGITKKQLVNELRKIAMFDIRKIFGEDDNLLPVKEFDEDSAGAVAGIDTDQLWGYDENSDSDKKTIIGQTKKVKIHNKIAAIERLSRMLGFDEAEKVKVAFSNEPVKFE